MSIWLVVTGTEMTLMNDITNHLPLWSHFSVLPLIWIKLTPLVAINKPTHQVTMVSLLMAWVKLNTKTMLWTELTHCLWIILIIFSNKILKTKKTLLNYIVFIHLFLFRWYFIQSYEVRWTFFEQIHGFEDLNNQIEQRTELIVWRLFELKKIWNWVKPALKIYECK